MRKTVFFGFSNGRGRQMATVAIAATLIAACSTSIPTTGASPTATELAATSSPSGSPKPVALDVALQFLWVGEPRAIPGLTPPANAAAMELSWYSLVLHPNVQPDVPVPAVLASSAQRSTDGGVELLLIRDALGCHVADDAIYKFELSPTGRSLTVQTDNDPCAARRVGLVGDWVRAGCPTRQWCLGDLDAGPHASINYRPRVPVTDWQFHYGDFRYVVPEGWTNPEDNPNGYVLVPTAGPEGSGIYVFSDSRAHRQGADCPHELAAGVEGAAGELTSWIKSLPGLRVTNSRPVTIGGLAGTEMDLAVKPAWKQACSDNGVQLLVNADSEDFDWGIAATGRMRLYVLSLGPGRSLIIDIEAQTPEAWQALLPDATRIVESFELGD
jgi:hypothetical protein